jgi:hypothetical protein
MKQRRAKLPKRSPNLAARALGSKIFGLKVVTPRKGYTRKLKHKAPVQDEAAKAGNDSD